MKPKHWNLFVGILTIVIIGISFFLPVLSLSIWDQRAFGQIISEDLELHTVDREPLDICEMLHMAYVNDNKAVLSRGKYLTPEEAFTQAKMALAPLESMDIFDIDWDGCALQSYSILFSISDDDMSKRMTLWILTVVSQDGAIMQISMDELSRKVLSFSYSNPKHPFFSSEIPPAQIQIENQELIDFFIDYWAVTVNSTTVVNGSGGYILSINNTKSGSSVEIPYQLKQDSIFINCAFN